MNTGSVKRVFLYSLCWFAGVLFALGYGAQVGDYVSHTTNGNMIVINNGGTQKVRITVCTPTIVRVEFDPRGTLTDTCDLLNADFMTKTWTPVQQPVVTDKGTSIEIATGKLTIQVQKSPLRIKWVETATGKELTGEDNTRGMAVGGGENPWLQLTQRPEEHYFGWGEAYGWLKKGQKQCDKKGLAMPTNDIRGIEAPFMYSTGGYAVLVLFGGKDPGHSVTPSERSPSYDLRGSYAKYQPASDYVPNMLGYYFITAPSGGASVNNWREIIDCYTQITGKPQILGKKWYGIQRDICDAGLSVTDMIAIADGWRKGRFPMDIVRNDLVFDFGKLGYLPNVPDQSRWNSGVPDMVTHFKNLGFTFGGMVNGFGIAGCCVGPWSGVLLEDSAHAKTAIDHGFDFAWYDAMTYHSRSRAQREFNVWKSAHGGDEAKTFVVKGWWSMCNTTYPTGITGDGLNNPNYAIFPAHLEHSLVCHVWSLTDIGENGAWNYAGTSLRPMICHHQSGSGGGATGQGCAGYFRVYNNTLYTSTMQDVIRKWAKFHYRFIPYLFTYGMIAHESGMPIWRHMVSHDPTDPNTYTTERQGYVGEQIIISPYYPDGDNNSGSRSGIYLPQGTWYDYFDGTKTAGPSTISYKCDPGTGMLDYKLPMFVKAGSIIPLMDTLQYIGERAESLLTVQVWPTNGTATTQSGSFTLYEDEGVWDVANRTRAPASKTPISFTFSDDGNNQQTGVTIGKFAGSAYCPQNKRIWRVELHNIKQVKQVVSNGTIWSTPISKAAYDAGTAGFYWDANGGGVCYINASGNAADGMNIFAATGVVSVGLPVGPLELSRNVSIVKYGQSIHVSVPFSGSHIVEVFNAQGRLLTRISGTGAQTHIVPLGHQAQMIGIVKVSAMGRSVIKRLSL